MIPSEVLKTWGPGAKGQADDYRGKGGLASARLDFARMPLSDVIHDDVKAIVGMEDRVQFLTSITFYPGEKPEPKSQVTADLVARFGEPIADARLSSHEHCESPRCELFRTGECTLAKVTFLPSDRDLPERLETLTHELGCLGLIDHVQRVSWTQLRGVVRTSFAPELQTAMDNLPRLSATPDDALKALGSPNFREGDPSTHLRLTYLWLDGSVARLSFESGRLESVQSLVQTR